MYSHYAQENRADTVSQITPAQLLRGGIATSEAPGVLVSALGQLGLLKEARPEAADVLLIGPNYTISRDERQIAPFRSAKHADHLFDGLRRAGLFER